MNFVIFLSLGTVAFLSAPFANAKPTICYQGQSYWCRNISTAVDCNAVNHCIHSVWEQEVPIEKDDSGVCQTCMDMVKLARDQLKSNETEEELREVLEGTCNAIPEKIMRKECDKMMDSLGSYIVDTLASQMDPAVVCSVAGLCYNDKFKNVKVIIPLNCDNCHGLMQIVERNIESASSSDIQRVLTNICKSLGRFSLVCMSLLSERMDTVEIMVRNNIVGKPVCDLAGVCTRSYHSHSIKSPFSRVPQDVQVFDKMLEDDLACDFCVQLVKHLKNVLIANTTETEFKMVLNGLCKMSSFKDECDEFVNQYYDSIYFFLLHELNGKTLCSEIKICPNNTRDSITSATAAQTLQLPIERISTTGMLPEMKKNSVQNDHKVLCSFCEYTLHVLQQEITLPSNERELTNIFEKACYTLPYDSVRETCKTFFDSYTAQLIALLSNDMDPSLVCPSLGVCPRTLISTESSNAKPSCPLCLLAMDKALQKINNRTETAIVDVLGDLCMVDEFPNSLLLECVNFITGYRRPISDMIVADFNSEEACVYIDLCSPPNEIASLPQIESQNIQSHPGSVETNEIKQYEDPLVCSICVMAVDEMEKHLLNNHTDEEIVDAFLSICNLFPKSEKTDCKKRVEDNRNLIINLVKRMTPRLACSVLCGVVLNEFEKPVKDCVTCEMFTSTLKDIMLSPEVASKNLDDNMEQACYQFPKNVIQSCREMMILTFGDKVKSLIAQKVPVGTLICRRLDVCSKDRFSQELHLLGSDVGPGCYSGPEYWCSTSGNAVECDKVEYCQVNVWMSEKPKRKLKGSDVM